MSSDIQELMKKDADDESLQRWKKQLLGASANAVPKTDDKRTIVIRKFGIIFPNKETEDLIRDVDGKEAVAALKKNPFVVKEGVDCKFYVEFNVNHKLINALSFQNKFWKLGGLLTGISSFLLKSFIVKNDFVMGGYAPSADIYKYTSQTFESPKGMTGRGSYKAKTDFVDIEKKNHLTIEYVFDVKKDF